MREKVQVDEQTSERSVSTSRCSSTVSWGSLPWETKIVRNRHRDEVTNAHLEALGWRVITVWECELRGKSQATSRLDTLAEEIREAGAAKSKLKELYKRNRVESIMALRVMMERQAQL